MRKSILIIIAVLASTSVYAETATEYLERRFKTIAALSVATGITTGFCLNKIAKRYGLLNPLRVTLASATGAIITPYIWAMQIKRVYSHELPTNQLWYNDANTSQQKMPR